MTGRFKVGDIVKFVEFGSHPLGPTIINYFSESVGIPEDKIVHGNIVLHKNYLKEFALVVDIWEPYCIVQYQDNKGNEVRLGFSEKSLELVDLGKFKIGDCVRISKPRDDNFYFLNGAEGVIIEIREMETGVHFPITVALTKLKYVIPKGMEGRDGTIYAFTKDELELIQSQEFDSGDSVVVASNFSGDSSLVGKRGVVGFCDCPPHSGVWVKMEGSNIPRRFNSQELLKDTT